MSSQRLHWVELIYNLILPIHGMEVRRIAVSVVHTYRDPAKLGKFRHEVPVQVPLASTPTAIYRAVASTKHLGKARCHFPMRPHRRA